MINLTTLFARAAELFDVSDGALRDGRGRTPRLVQARQALAWVLYQRDYSVTEIGVMLRRDHSTISYSHQQAAQRMRDDAEYAANCRELLALAQALAAPRRAIAAAPAPLHVTLAFWGVAAPLAA